ncbi:MAG: hypothetical protein L6305_08525 [Actinomycetia bacterium]|nr:hypothetical protein [bacterium]MCG2791773.1 hypothetical protein [Actinomycetes bacterium]
MKKTILPLIAIVGNASIARALSERFTGSKYYFAIMEEPWVSRPDAENEITRRNNLLASFQHEYLILAGCGEKTRELFMKHFPRKYHRRVIVIEEDAGIDKFMGILKKYLNKSTVDKQYIDLSELQHLATSEQIAVIEKSDSIGEVIAENFCIANGYKILKVEKVTKELADEVDELLRNWNLAEDSLIRKESKDELFKIFRSRVGKLEEFEFRRVVFFTNGIPYGILPFRSPVAHFLLERDLGLQILRGYRRINEGNSSFALSMICDPGDIPDTESVRIKKKFKTNGIDILDLSGANAQAYRFMHLIERYPFDFIMISSHAGELSGKRITSKVTSSKGIINDVVYDLYACFALEPGEDTVTVTELIIPVSIDGILWTDKKQLRENDRARHFNFEEFRKNINYDKKEKIIKIEDRKGVKFSSALQLYKGSWIPALHTVGDIRYPIIFNNACSSWIEMANRFLFAGASVYIGTTKDINTIMAFDCGIKFIEFALKQKSMLFSLFRAQNTFVMELGYSPYLYWGHPDISLRPTYLDAQKIKRQRIQDVISGLYKMLFGCKDDIKKKTIRCFIKCILEAG